MRHGACCARLSGCSVACGVMGWYWVCVGVLRVASVWVCGVGALKCGGVGGRFVCAVCVGVCGGDVVVGWDRCVG